MNRKQVSILSLFLGLVLGIAASLIYFYFQNDGGLINPLVFSGRKAKELPLLKYKISELAKLDLIESNLSLQKELAKNEFFDSYLFSYQTQGGSMSGQINLPKKAKKNQVILLIRGYVPPEIYQTGAGTKAAANFFAEKGYVTVAPDFLGYGESSPDFTDTWEGRFVKPVQMMELYKNLLETDFDYLICQSGLILQNPKIVCLKQDKVNKIGVWAHSNGGQIALTMLEGLSEPVPATLWAPVTAPFPYSVLFFSDEMEDEGKASRNWVSQFEREYDVFDFSLTKHLNLLQGPLRIHHGRIDEAALFSWSLEFADKIEQENQKRTAQRKVNKESTDSAQVEVLPDIEFELFAYEEADHNLKPNWNEVIQSDLTFFEKELGN